MIFRIIEQMHLEICCSDLDRPADRSLKARREVINQKKKKKKAAGSHNHINAHLAFPSNERKKPSL